MLRALIIAGIWAAAAVLAFTLPGAWWILALVVAAVAALGTWDLVQTRHSVLRAYPVVGHARFLAEHIRPEIYQYFVESNTDGAPFDRETRDAVYRRSKGTKGDEPFGTERDVTAVGYEFLRHSLRARIATELNPRVRLGGPDCTQPYDIALLNVSAMSFGALSGNAIEALNGGAAKGGFAHDSGEGGISPYHLKHGGDLIWEIGSGYFGCRDAQGRFDTERFVENAGAEQVRMIEVKLSQGAKPGHGGVLPGPKVTPEIAAARGVPPWTDCVSPASHSAFDTPIGLLRFVDRLRTLSGGKPTGFKLAIGHPWEWFAIAKAMQETGITPDFIVVDGKEGGTGASPAEFIDRVGTPMQEALMLVHNTLIGIGLRDRVRIGAAGKLTSAFDVARTMALGADWCNSARGFMFALGCIQAMNCHTGRCPTGVTTQDPVRQRALVVPDKAERVFNFHQNTLKALAELVAAAGLTHPSQLRSHHIVRRVSGHEIRLLSTLYPALQPGELLDGDADAPVYRMFWSRARPDSFAPAA